MGAGDDGGDRGAPAGVVERPVGLAQVGRGGGPVDQGLGEPELDEQVGTPVRRHRLVQGTAQQQDGAVGGPPPDRGVRRGAQGGDRRRAAAVRGQQEVGRDLLGRCPVRREHLRGPLVVQGALGGGQVLVHRVAHERVDERRRVLGPEDLAAAQRVERGGGALLGLSGEGRHRRQVSGAPEHGDGPGDGRQHGGHPAQAQHHQAGHRTRPHRPDRVGVRDVGPDALGLQGSEQLPQQQRVARRRPVAHPDEGVRRRPEPLLHEDPGRLRRQRARTQHGRRGVQDELGEQRLVRVTLAGPHGGDDQHGQTLEALDEVREEAQRRAVAVLDVVDREHERALGGEVHGQPVQAVQHGEPAVGRVVPADLVEHGPGAGRGAAQQGRAARLVRDDRLEELADGAERERALELGAPGGEDRDAGRRRRAGPPRRAAGSCRSRPARRRGRRRTRRRAGPPGRG